VIASIEISTFSFTSMSIFLSWTFFRLQFFHVNHHRDIHAAVFTAPPAKAGGTDTQISKNTGTAKPVSTRFMVYTI
jgi:hypothetical protein